MTLPAFAPGIYDIPDRLYHAAEGLSSHGMMDLIRSPAHYKVARETPDEQKPNGPLPVGSLLHRLVLEPARGIDDGFFIYDDKSFNRRTNKGRDDWAELIHEADRTHRHLVERESAKLMQSVALLVRDHPVAGNLFRGGAAEQSIWWNDPETGVLCKCRLDYVLEDVVTDLKSCIDARPRPSERAMADYLYYLQAAHYLSGATYGHNRPFRTFIFVFVEKEPPHGISCYVVDDESIEFGHRHAHEAIRSFKACSDSGVWPAYAPEIKPIALPPWKLRG